MVGSVRSSARCDGQIDGDEIVRPEREAAQSGPLGILRSLGKGGFIAHGEVEAAVDAGPIPSAVRAQDETEVERMRAPRTARRAHSTAGRSGEGPCMRTGEHLDDGAQLPPSDHIDGTAALE